MTPTEIVAVLRRQLAAAIVICVIASASCLYLLHKNPGYQDSAEVAFTAPTSWGPKAAFADNDSLLTVEQVSGWYMMGSAGQQEVRQSGGTGDYDVAFFNAYNEEYPDYSQPYVLVTASSKSPAVAQLTFNAVISVMQANLRNRQLAAGASATDLALARVASGPTGPVIQSGSHKRTLISFALLTIIALISITAFLDRRGFRRLKHPIFARLATTAGTSKGNHDAARNPA